MTDLFLDVLNISIVAGWVILAVLAARLLLKRAPKWSIMPLWGIVAIRLLCPFSIESLFSLIPSAETFSPDIMVATKPTVHSGIPTLNAVINPVLGQTLAPTPSEAVYPMQVLFTVASVVWMAGVVGMTLYAVCSYLRLRRRVATAVRLEDNVFQSEFVTSPFVFGFVRPRVYLPYSMDEADQIYVVAHERCHIRRKDHWWKPLGFVLLSIHWFNPLMWLAYILLCRDIELACDEKVIRELGADQRADYSEALLACSVKRVMIAACPLAFGEIGVKERVKNVLSYKKPAFWIILVAVIVCIAVAICFLTDPITKDKTQGTQSSQRFPEPAELFYPVHMMAEGEIGDFQLEAFPDVTFHWEYGKVEAVTLTDVAELFAVKIIYNIAAADLNMDGYPEICATVGSDDGCVYVHVYDYMAGKSYTVGENEAEYYLYMQGGCLMCAKDALSSGVTLQSGRLMLANSDGEMGLVITAPWVPQQPDGNAVIWYDKDNPDSPNSGRMELEAFPGVVFYWSHTPNVRDHAEGLMVLEHGTETKLFPEGATDSVYVTDITGDGKPDFCANVYFSFSGMASYNAVFVYDYANDVYYTLADDHFTGHRTKVSYYVRLDGDDLVCDKIHEATDQTLATGVLKFADGEDGKQIYLEAQITYDSPVEYIFTGEHIWWDRVELTVCADGSCDIVFNPKLNEDGTFSWAQGTYTKSDGKLILLTEDGRTYTFRFQEDDLVFLAEESDPLPDNCPMFDGAVLEADPYFP